MTEQNKPVVVRLASGSEYGLKSAAEAKRIYPNGTIVRHQDGSPYEAPQDDTGPNLKDLTRDELDAYAEKVGVDPTAYGTKGELLTALEGNG